MRVVDVSDWRTFFNNGLLRISLGLEGGADLIAEVDRAPAAVDCETLVQVHARRQSCEAIDHGGTWMNEPHDLGAWRKEERARLIDARMAIPREIREASTERIARELEALMGDVAGLVVSAYWPFRGEPDLKPLLHRLRERGAITALPVVRKKAHPLVFRAWQSGDKLERGIWNIPIPAEGADVVPDIAIAPVVGFDRSCFRLGYGGGFFDRTLASLPRMPRFFGVGYAVQEIATIRPQPHDIPMQAVVTEVETVRPA